MASTTTDRTAGLVANAAIKMSCRVATTANITLSGLQTIDGVTVVAGDRVLVKNQTTGSENGIYVASDSTWTRARDADSNDSISYGTRVFVVAGTAGALLEYALTTTGSIVIGTTSLTFSLTAASGGDMLQSVYDPNTVQGDAFDMDNMVEGSDTKIMTSAERAAIAALGSTYQPLDADLTAIAALSTTSYGRALLVLADQAALQTAVNVEDGATADQTAQEIATAIDADATAEGTLKTALDVATLTRLASTATGDGAALIAIEDAGAMITAANVEGALAELAAAINAITADYLTSAAIGSSVQAYSAVLATYAGITPSANVQSLLGAADYAAMRTLLDLEAGTDFYSISAADAAFQPLDSDLTAIAALTTTAAALTLLEIADPGADRLVVWDDTAGAFVAMALADFTAEGAPASGDYIIIYGAEGDVRKVDWDDLPGAVGGISDVVDDTTPQLGGALDGQGYDITGIGVLTMVEQAAAEADVAGNGQFWVKTATPNVAMFTDDAGTDWTLANGVVTISDEPGDVTITVADANTLFRFDTSGLSADATLNMPAGSGLPDGFKFGAVLEDDTYFVNVDANGSELFTGSYAAGTGVYTLTLQGQVAWFCWNGTGWDVIAEAGLVEEGSNGNGEYVRHADGRQECHNIINHTSDSFTTSIGALYGTSLQSWTYPASFSSVIQHHASAQRTNDTVIAGCSLRNVNTSLIDYIPWLSASTSGGGTRQAMLSAWGRWY